MPWPALLASTLTVRVSVAWALEARATHTAAVAIRFERGFMAILVTGVVAVFRHLSSQTKSPPQPDIADAA